MKVIATRWICDQSPKGAILDVPEADAQTLIELGLAQIAPDDTTPSHPAIADDVVVTPRRRGRYARRDLTASA